MTSDEKPGERDDERSLDSVDDARDSDTDRPQDPAPAEDAADPEPPADTGTMIAGLFGTPAQDDDEEDADDDREDGGAADPGQSAPPQTDSVRVIAEMFSGFRRRSATPERDLEEMLGTATQAIAIVPPPAPQEPPTVAGPLPIVAAADAAADADVTRASETDDDGPPPAEEDPVPADQQQPTAVKTAYVPRHDGNQTEQALAWLTAENVATGQTPVVGAPVALTQRRRRRWVGAILAPIFTAIVLAVVYVVAFAVWPLDNVAPTMSAKAPDTPVGPALDVPWPVEGQSAILVEGVDGIVTSAEEDTRLDPAPMASLTKVITVMTLLERQPLELGEDGPVYEFGYLDQQQADNLRFQNESALDVPIGGILSYRQLLEGILMGSAGNYANKLVDDLWEFDRNAYLGDAIAWLQDNGLEDTLVVDATGISPENQSTAEDMVRVAQIAMQNPVVAEIVAQEEVEMPGPGLVENSNPLMGENGIVGIKTGHLDEWNIVSYNLMTAKDIEFVDSEDPVRVYTAVMGQADSDLQASTTRDVLDAITQALQPVEAVGEGTVVATVTTEWGGQTDVVLVDTAELTLWSGEEAEIETDVDVDLGDAAGATVGTMTVSGGLDSAEVDLVTTDELPRPSIEWRLTHPLELLGLGA